MRVRTVSMRAGPPGMVLLGIAVLAGATLLAQEKKDSPPPYSELGKMGAGFFGPGRGETAPLPDEGVKIGLAGPEKTPEGQEFKLAAEIAIEEKNAAGGFQGKPFIVVFRADDGPWGVASKAVTALAFDEEVWGILGGFDGTRAHLAELIVAKAWVPVVTPLASDLSIDFANVPWMFRVMPSDAIQAQALFAHAANHGLRRIAAFIEGERDSLIAGERVEEAARKLGVSLVLQVQISPQDPEADLERLEGVEADALLLWGREGTGLRFARALRAAGNRLPILSPESLATPAVLAESECLGDLVVAAPLDWSNPDPALQEFCRYFQTRAGRPPGSIAVCAYDATRLLLEAIERAGLSRARIRDEIAKMVFKGLGGEIRFNELGGNMRSPVLVKPATGCWVRVEPNAESAGRERGQ
ncbi:MAG: ABC transporter substrate-binding protein [Planctomycetota bacterium]